MQNNDPPIVAFKSNLICRLALTISLLKKKAIYFLSIERFLFKDILKTTVIPQLLILCSLKKPK